jgi:hypothetical protein
LYTEVVLFVICLHFSLELIEIDPNHPFLDDEKWMTKSVTCSGRAALPLVNARSSWILG